MTKNILVLGRTGEGKSALINTLINKNNNFEPVFKEDGDSNDNLTFEVEINGINYQLIENHEIYEISNLEKTLNLLNNTEEIHQILWVIGGRFTGSQLVIYNLLKDIIFSEDITQYITIVCTKFPHFDDEEKCEKNLNSLKEKTIPEIAEIAKKVKFVFVNNSYIRSEKKGQILTEKQISYNESAKVDRKESREILIKFLENVVSDSYKVKVKDNLATEITNFLTKEEQKNQERTKVFSRVFPTNNSSRVVSPTSKSTENKTEQTKKIFDNNDFIETEKEKNNSFLKNVFSSP